MSNAIVPEFHTVSRSEVHQINKALEQALHTGKLTLEMLHDAIAALHGSEDLQSVGIEFIRTYPGAFTELVPVDGRMDFYMTHLDNPVVIEVIADDALLTTVPEEWREQLVRDVTATHPMPSADWIRVAAKAGVEHETLFECILMQLDGERFDMRQSRPFAKSFLCTGAGSQIVMSRRFFSNGSSCFELVDRNPIWAIVPKEQFKSVVTQCVYRAPELLFTRGTDERPDLRQQLMAVRPNLDDRSTGFGEPPLMLSQAAIQRLCNAAAQRLTTLEEVDVEMLLELPFIYQKDIVERHLPGSLEFLVRATLLHNEHESNSQAKVRLQFFDEHFAQTEYAADEAFMVFRQVSRELEAAMASHSLYRAAIRIKRAFEALLSRHGYFVGRLKHQRGPHGRLQVVLEVVLNSRKYKFVQNNRQDRVFKPGAYVYADANSDHYLARRLRNNETVLFANFHYVDPTKEIGY